MAESSSTGGPQQQHAGKELRLKEGIRGQCVDCHATLVCEDVRKLDNRTKCRVHFLLVPLRAKSRARPPPAMAGQEYPPPLSQEPAPPASPGKEVIDVTRDDWPSMGPLLEALSAPPLGLSAPPLGLSAPPVPDIAPVPELAPVAGADGLSAPPSRPEVLTVEKESSCFV